MGQPLEGLRVLELATGVAGPFTSKLLADYGADVVKVEPPGGDPARLCGPFPGDEPDPEQSALFLHLNANKRSVVADITTPEGRDLVCQLAAGVDAVIESSPPGTLDEVGLGFAALQERNPALVLTSVTPFGQTGPYAGYAGADIVTYAMAGPMHATGVSDREPLKLGGHVTTYQCGNLAATATLAALTMAEQSGVGTHIDLSMFEAQAASIDRRVTFLLWHQWSGLNVPRQSHGGARQLPNGFFPTADGHVMVATIQPWASRMLDVLDDDGLRERLKDPGWVFDDDVADEILAVFYPWLFEGDNADRARAAQAHKWAMTPLNPPIDVLNDPHFAERGYFVETDHPVAGRFRQTGPPFRLGVDAGGGEGDGGDDGDVTGNAWQRRCSAPTLDQHGNEIRAAITGDTAAHDRQEWTGATPPPRSTPSATAAAKPTENRLPLEGVRVLDLTVVWAGPACTMHLADLGAEVIRVDNPWVFPPATRGTSPRPDPALLVDYGPLGGGYPNLDSSGRPWNKHSMWSAHARNKLSCTLDVRTELGHETFLRLVDHSDVLVENNSVPTLDKLGIGWDTLHARNPRLIMMRMPPMALTGRYADYVGFGISFESLCGLTAIRGYRDDDPTSTTSVFHMDPSSGAAGAFAAMCALRRRDQTGVGELVELAQSENMMQHIGEYFIDADRTGRRHGPAGNRDLTHAPQGCYPCVGDDRWVAISVRSDTEWAGLCRAMGTADPGPGAGSDLVADTRFTTPASRMAHHDELDEIITAWTSNLDRHEVFKRCQTEGVPAGPVLNEADLYADPHLAARNWFRPQGSEDVGTWPFPGHQWRWTGPDLRWGPICRLGADNEYVYRDLVGLSNDEYQALDDAGHLSLDYLKPDGTPW